MSGLREWGARARARAAVELRAIRRVFKFTPENSRTEKVFVWILLTGWTIVMIGIAYGVAEPTTEYSMITALIWALVGRIWGGETKDITSGAGGGG